MKIAPEPDLAGIAWRLIARRRAALARERRARQHRSLLVTAGGAGLILAAPPRILEGARRLRDLARRQINDETRVGLGAPQRDLEKRADGAHGIVCASKGQRASSVGPRSTSNTRAVAITAPNPGLKTQGEERSEPPTDPSLKH